MENKLTDNVITRRYYARKFDERELIIFSIQTYRVYKIARRDRMATPWETGPIRSDGANARVQYGEESIAQAIVNVQ
jgi:hypothetical protein